MIKAMIDQATGRMVREMDAEISTALATLQPVWSEEEIRRRCKMVRVSGSPVETLCVDGKPLMEIHPIESELERKDNHYVRRYTQKFRMS